MADIKLQYMYAFKGKLVALAEAYRVASEDPALAEHKEVLLEAAVRSMKHVENAQEQIDLYEAQK